MAKKLTSDATTFTIDTLTLPKNVVTISVSGDYFTIKAWGQMTITDRVIYSEFTDNTGAPYTTPALLLTALKTAAYA